MAEYTRVQGYYGSVMGIPFRGEKPADPRENMLSVWIVIIIH